MFQDYTLSITSAERVDQLRRRIGIEPETQVVGC
jgi:hypothetical protein